MTAPRSSYTMDLTSNMGLRPLAHGQKSSTYDNLSNYQKRSDEDDYDWLSVAGPSTPVTNGRAVEMTSSFSAFDSSIPYTLSVSTSALFSSESSVTEGRPDEGAAERGCMSGTDYAIYNSLGADSSRHRGKVWAHACMLAAAHACARPKLTVN